MSSVNHKKTLEKIIGVPMAVRLSQEAEHLASFTTQQYKIAPRTMEHQLVYERCWNTVLMAHLNELYKMPEPSSDYKNNEPRKTSTP